MPLYLLSVVSEAVGKQFFCRVPDGMHSANLLALGKSPVSSSEGILEKKNRLEETLRSLKLGRDRHI